MSSGFGGVWGGGIGLGPVGPTGATGPAGATGATGATGAQGPSDPFSMVVYGRSVTVAPVIVIDRTVGVVVYNFAATTYTGVRFSWLHLASDTIVVTAWVAGVLVATGTAVISTDGDFTISFATPYTVAAATPIAFGLRCTTSNRYMSFNPTTSSLSLFSAPVLGGRWTYQKLASFASGNAAPTTECWTASQVGFPIDPVPQ